MVDRQIKKILLNKLDISPQALSLQTKKIKTKHGPMSTEEATYVIAHQHGIDLSQFLPIDIMDRVRSLIPKELPNVVQSSPSINKKREKTKKSAKSYPLVSDNLIKKGMLIGNESFPKMFVLENSIRNLIIQRLSKAYKKNWWNEARIKNVRENVEKLINKEKKYPNRDKRGLHPIYYSNFADLKNIILNEFDYFSDVILDRQWFTVQMEQVYMSRNSLAHNVALTEDDEMRIRLLYSEWARILESAGIK
jgi:hypothetical protein